MCSDTMVSTAGWLPAAIAEKEISITGRHEYANWQKPQRENMLYHVKVPKGLPKAEDFGKICQNK